MLLQQFASSNIHKCFDVRLRFYAHINRWNGDISYLISCQLHSILNWNFPPEDMRFTDWRRKWAISVKSANPFVTAVILFLFNQSTPDIWNRPLFATKPYFVSMFNEVCSKWSHCLEPNVQNYQQLTIHFHCFSNERIQYRLWNNSSYHMFSQHLLETPNAVWYALVHSLSMCLNMQISFHIFMARAPNALISAPSIHHSSTRRAQFD